MHRNSHWWHSDVNLHTTVRFPNQDFVIECEILAIWRGFLLIFAGLQLIALYQRLKVIKINIVFKKVLYNMSQRSFWSGCLKFVEFCLLWKFFGASLPSVLWHYWLGGRKDIRPVKNWVVGCWHGCLTGARCRLAYGPADGSATHCLLLQ